MVADNMAGCFFLFFFLFFAEGVFSFFLVSCSRYRKTLAWSGHFVEGTEDVFRAVLEHWSRVSAQAKRDMMGGGGTPFRV